MIETTPQVRLIASPRVHWDVVEEYLAGIGGSEWARRVRSEPPYPCDAEALVEYAGRRCYKSWVEGINPNVTRVRKDSGDYLENILRSKHGAVLEHAQFTFDFDNVSRIFTHELVRHRAGVAISQESLRYVRLEEIGFRIPDVLANGPDMPGQVRDGWWGDPSRDDPKLRHPTMRESIVSLVERLEEFQRDAAAAFGLDDEGVPFHYKKEVTSALRRLAPLGLSTGMVWSANVRTLRHVCAIRTAPGAEEEIRMVFDRVTRIMQEQCPLLFGDFKGYTVEGSDVPEWRPAYEKV